MTRGGTLRTLVHVKLVIGLGNPGGQYAETRHNIGWMVLDRIADRLGRAGRGRQRDASASIQVRLAGEDVILAKPLTYMNDSGIAVRKLLARERAPLIEVLVVADDFALPFGKLRFREARRRTAATTGCARSSTSSAPRSSAGCGWVSASPVAARSTTSSSRFHPDERQRLGDAPGRGGRRRGGLGSRGHGEGRQPVQHVRAPGEVRGRRGTAGRRGRRTARQGRRAPHEDRLAEGARPWGRRVSGLGRGKTLRERRLAEKVGPRMGGPPVGRRRRRKRRSISTGHPQRLRSSSRRARRPRTDDRASSEGAREPRNAERRAPSGPGRRPPIARFPGRRPARARSLDAAAAARVERRLRRAPRTSRRSGRRPVPWPPRRPHPGPPRREVLPRRDARGAGRPASASCGSRATPRSATGSPRSCRRGSAIPARSPSWSRAPRSPMSAASSSRMRPRRASPPSARGAAAVPGCSSPASRRSSSTRLRPTTCPRSPACSRSAPASRLEPLAARAVRPRVRAGPRGRRARRVRPARWDRRRVPAVGAAAGADGVLRRRDRLAARLRPHRPAHRRGRRRGHAPARHRVPPAVRRCRRRSRSAWAVSRRASPSGSRRTSSASRARSRPTAGNAPRPRDVRSRSATRRRSGRRSSRPRPASTMSTPARCSCSTSPGDLAEAGEFLWRQADERRAELVESGDLPKDLADRVSRPAKAWKRLARRRADARADLGVRAARRRWRRSRRAA